MKVHIKPNGVMMRTIVTRCYIVSTDDGRIAKIYEVNGELTPECTVEMTEEKFEEMCSKYKGYQEDDSDDEW